jgi:hypothetical protein
VVREVAAASMLGLERMGTAPKERQYESALQQTSEEAQSCGFGAR